MRQRLSSSARSRAAPAGVMYLEPFKFIGLRCVRRVSPNAEIPEIQGFCGVVHSFHRRPSLLCQGMGVKYYTHFVMSEQPQRASEFTGVVELNREPKRTNNLREVAAILARSL